ncbi:MAG TPA: hypothetical protein P5121_03620 [Caldilineaceae bacterium]|nr:hypothetical protein [Caldilineaceae bacterium]
MKVPSAARYNAVIWLSVLGATPVLLLPGLRMVGVQFIRQAWILEHPAYWMMGWWIWLMAIFGWMWLLVALAWTYLPAHRVASLLQSGLMIIGAVLLIAGVIVWMGVLPVVMVERDATVWIRVLDALALNLLGGGALMGGIVTMWIGLDLYRQRLLNRWWVLLCILAGLFALPSPFLFPLGFPFHLIPAILCWVLWSGYLALLPRLPSPFAEYPHRYT